MIDAQVAADADQPGLEVRAAIERVERLEQLQEDVLRQVLGLVVTADELVRDVENLPPVLADDRFPRGLIAAQTALDDLVGHLCWGEARQQTSRPDSRACARARNEEPQNGQSRLM